MLHNVARDGADAAALSGNRTWGTAPVPTASQRTDGPWEAGRRPSVVLGVLGPSALPRVLSLRLEAAAAGRRPARTSGARGGARRGGYERPAAGVNADQQLAAAAARRSPSADHALLRNPTASGMRPRASRRPSTVF